MIFFLVKLDVIKFANGLERFGSLLAAYETDLATLELELTKLELKTENLGSVLENLGFVSEALKAETGTKLAVSLRGEPRSSVTAAVCLIGLLDSLDLGGSPIHELMSPLSKADFLKFLDTHQCFGNTCFFFVHWFTICFNF
jgi:hypothetical protein